MVFVAFGPFRRSAGDDATPSVSVCRYPRRGGVSTLNATARPAARSRDLFLFLE